MKRLPGHGSRVGVALLLATALWTAGVAVVRAEDDPAGRAALAWLALVDKDDYQLSWQTAGALFQRAVSVQAWTDRMNEARQSLGAASSRREASRRNHKQLPGVPDGDYLVMVFNTSFAHKAQAVETMTLRRQDDGAWRVVGYFIR